GSPAWSVYRIPTGGSDPGVMSIDANLLDDGSGKASGYYVAFADYGSGRWQWHGPFSDSHVRLGLPDGGLLSSVNSFFAAVLVSGGYAADVVALGLERRTAADLEAPPVPQGLTATAVTGGAELQWNPVLAGDLAGYRILWSSQAFTDAGNPG